MGVYSGRNAHKRLPRNVAAGMMNATNTAAVEGANKPADIKAANTTVFTEKAVIETRKKRCIAACGEFVRRKVQ